MYKKFIFGLIAFIAVVAITATNMYVSFSNNIRGLSDISKATLEAFADKESENGKKVKIIIEEDMGRITICIDGVYRECNQIVVTCNGTGALTCPTAEIYYENCTNVY